MRILAVLFTVLFLIGCSSVSQQYIYTPKNSTQKLAISAKSEIGLTNKISILINGEVVSKGTLHDFKIRDTFYGRYNNYSITSECTQAMKWDGSYAFDCTISIDNNYVSHLIF